MYVDPFDYPTGYVFVLVPTTKDKTQRVSSGSQLHYYIVNRTEARRILSFHARSGMTEVG